MNGDRRYEGWFGETDLQTGATTEKDAQHHREMVGNGVGVCAGGGKFSSHCARAWALTLTPEEHPRLRICAAPGFSVLVLGFQPRLLGNRTVTSRTDVTTVHYRTRYPGPIVDPRIGLRSPFTGMHSYRDVDFGNCPPRSC